MTLVRPILLLQRAAERELNFCRRVNHALGQPATQGFFSVFSRLGDGVFWYALIIVLPIIQGSAALAVSLLMLIVGVVNLLIYKTIKHLTCRERPCGRSADIIPGARLLDHYSFPSGHTLHAVGFTTVLMHTNPQLGLGVLPFTVLVASSRVVLGLHYPTDVAAGALIGAGVANVFIVLTALY